jgi:hypothetical protein
MKFIDCIEKFAHLVPGCPEPQMVDALRSAVIEFCAKSMLLTRWVDKTSNALTFDMTGAAATMPVALFDAYVNGVQADIYHVNAPQLVNVTEQRPAITYSNDQIADSLAITPAPSVPVPVRLLVAVSPTPDANEYPDSLWMMRREALKAGALSRLLAEPGAPYFNDALASRYRAVFDEAMASASTLASVNRSTSTARLRVTPSA